MMSKEWTWGATLIQSWKTLFFTSIENMRLFLPLLYLEKQGNVSTWARWKFSDKSAFCQNVAFLWKQAKFNWTVLRKYFSGLARNFLVKTQLRPYPSPPSDRLCGDLPSCGGSPASARDTLLKCLILQLSTLATSKFTVVGSLLPH